MNGAFVWSTVGMLLSFWFRFPYYTKLPTLQEHLLRPESPVVFSFGEKEVTRWCTFPRGGKR